MYKREITSQNYLLKYYYCAKTWSGSLDEWFYNWEVVTKIIKSISTPYVNHRLYLSTFPKIHWNVHVVPNNMLPQKKCICHLISVACSDASSIELLPSIHIKTIIIFCHNTKRKYFTQTKILTFSQCNNITSFFGC